MVILSLDCSTNSTGYNVYDTTKKSLKARLRASGVISIPSGRSYSEKLDNFVSEIRNLIITYRPDIILREEFITNVKGMSNKQAIISMGAFHKILEWQCYIHNVTLINITIKDIKRVLNLTSEITIPRGLPRSEKIKLKKMKREEKKRNTIEKINKIYKLDLCYDTKGDEDIADSYSVLEVYLDGIKND